MFLRINDLFTFTHLRVYDLTRIHDDVHKTIVVYILVWFIVPIFECLLLWYILRQILTRSMYRYDCIMCVCCCFPGLLNKLNRVYLRCTQIIKQIKH